MVLKNYTLFIAGIGYLGYNLAKNYVDDGGNVVILTRYKSIVKRIDIYNRLRDLGVKIVGGREIDPSLALNVIDRYGVPNDIYYLAGVVSGSKYYMRYVHGELSHRIANRIFNRSGFRGRYIHISAYNTGYVLSSYVESKVYGEGLLKRLAQDGNNVVILRPGLLVGLYPPHPEWIQLYMISKMGITLETGIYTGYTPIAELYHFIKYLEDKDIWLKDPIDFTIYQEDIGFITMVFTERLGIDNPVRLRLRKPDWIWKILPYTGRLGFIRNFLYPGRPPKPYTVFRLGYKPIYRLTDEIGKTLESLINTIG